MAMKQRPWWARVILWLGIGLCVYAVLHAVNASSVQLDDVLISTWISAAALLLGMWLMAVVAWIFFVHAHTGEFMRLDAAAKQSGLLLVGKYVPGGVFGFIARLQDGGSDKRKALIVSGLVEQIVGLSAPVLIGSVAYLVSTRGWHFALILPLVPIFLFYFSLKWGRFVPFRSIRARLNEFLTINPNAGSLFLACLLASLQVAVYMGVVALLTVELFSVDWLTGIGVAGAFGLSVALGMAAVVVPGGIVIREGALVLLALPFLAADQAVVIAALMRILLTLLDFFAGVTALVVNLTESRPDEVGGK